MNWLYIGAGQAVTVCLALFFYRCWILEKERRRSDLKSIAMLRQMVLHRDALSLDPGAVDKLFDVFAPRADETVRAGAGAEDDDRDGKGGAEPDEPSGA